MQVQDLISFLEQNFDGSDIVAIVDNKSCSITSNISIERDRLSDYKEDPTYSDYCLLEVIESE